jgi:hypothetical protein
LRRGETGVPPRRQDDLSHVSVFDGQRHVGDVIDRADGGGFDAVTNGGELVGIFAIRLEAYGTLPSERVLGDTAGEKIDGGAA